MNDEKRVETAAPYPDWYLELKLERKWLVMHREDGPPPTPAKAPEIVLGEEEIYFIQRWAGKRLKASFVEMLCRAKRAVRLPAVDEPRCQPLKVRD